LLSINAFIGSGIFLILVIVVQLVVSKSLFVYLVTPSFVAILVILFAAASKYVTKSGAFYAYSWAAFGKKIGFYMGVLRFFSASVAWGVMAVGVIKSTISIFRGNPNNPINVTIEFLILMAIIIMMY